MDFVWLKKDRTLTRCLALANVSKQFSDDASQFVRETQDERRMTHPSQHKAHPLTQVVLTHPLGKADALTWRQERESLPVEELDSSRLYNNPPWSIARFYVADHAIARHVYYGNVIRESIRRI
jgi:hypothetical protein